MHKFTLTGVPCFSASPGACCLCYIISFIKSALKNCLGVSSTLDESQHDSNPSFFTPFQAGIVSLEKSFKAVGSVLICILDRLSVPKVHRQRVGPLEGIGFKKTGHRTRRGCRSLPYVPLVSLCAQIHANPYKLIAMLCLFLWCGPAGCQGRAFVLSSATEPNRLESTRSPRFSRRGYEFDSGPSGGPGLQPAPARNRKLCIAGARLEVFSQGAQCQFLPTPCDWCSMPWGRRLAPVGNS